jgi:hypothetical protein
MNEYMITPTDGQEIVVEADSFSDADQQVTEMGLTAVDIAQLR